MTFYHFANDWNAEKCKYACMKRFSYDKWTKNQILSLNSENTTAVQVFVTSDIIENHKKLSSFPYGSK